MKVLLEDLVALEYIALAGWAFGKRQKAQGAHGVAGVLLANIGHQVRLPGAAKQHFHQKLGTLVI